MYSRQVAVLLFATFASTLGAPTKDKLYMDRHGSHDFEHDDDHHDHDHDDEYHDGDDYDDSYEMAPMRDLLLPEGRLDYDDDDYEWKPNPNDGCNGCEQAPMKRSDDIERAPERALEEEPFQSLKDTENVDAEAEVGMIMNTNKMLIMNGSRSWDDYEYKQDDDYEWKPNPNDGCNGCEQAPMKRSDDIEKTHERELEQELIDDDEEKAPMKRSYDTEKAPERAIEQEPFASLKDNENVDAEAEVRGWDDYEYKQDDDYEWKPNPNDGCNGCEQAPPI